MLDISETNHENSKMAPPNFQLENMSHLTAQFVGGFLGHPVCISVLMYIVIYKKN